MIESNRQRDVDESRSRLGDVATKTLAIKLVVFVIGYTILGSAFVPRVMRWMDAHEIPPLIEDLIMCSVLVAVVAAAAFFCLRHRGKGSRSASLKKSSVADWEI